MNYRITIEGVHGAPVKMEADVNGKTIVVTKETLAAALAHAEDFVRGTIEAILEHRPGNEPAPAPVSADAPERPAQTPWQPEPKPAPIKADQLEPDPELEAKLYPKADADEAATPTPDASTDPLAPIIPNPGDGIVEAPALVETPVVPSDEEPLKPPGAAEDHPSDGA